MRKQLFVSLLCAAALAACNKSNPSSSQQSQPAQAPAAAPAGAAPAAAPAAATGSSALMDPSKATEKAPDLYKVKFTTTKGDFVVEVHRDWAPNGADRLYNLVKIGYFTDIAFFRDVAGFMVQFGIHGRPEVNNVWWGANIPDDPASGHSNEPGAVTFATAGPNTRTSQLFISFGNNSFLDNQGFTPIGKVAQGMDVVNNLYNGYGEGAPQGQGPDQGRIKNEGNDYLRKDFPKLDYIKSAAVQ